MAKWHEFRNRHIPCVLPLLYYWSWPISHVTGAEVGVRVNVWENGDYRVYWTEQGYSLTAQYAFNYLRKNARNLGQVRKAGIAAGKKVVRHCKSFASKSANASLNEFLTFLKKLELLHNEFTKKSMLIWLTAGDILEAKIREGLEGKPGAENIIRIMLKPRSKSYSQIEEEEFEKVVLLAQQEGIDGKRTKGSITKFSKKYFWFPFEYVGPEVWDEQAVRRRVQEVLKAGITKTDAGKEGHIKGLSKRVKELFNIAQTVTLMQDDRKMLHSQICYYLNGIILMKLAEKIGVGREIYYIENQLLEEVIRGRDRLSVAEELEERKKFCVMIQEKGPWEIHTGERARGKLRRLGILSIYGTKQEELRGVVANPGFARGTVRVLRTSSNADFKSGQILVTGMTTPDFAPLIRKAGAILTDEGGITCHAAIVSREMNKPCITGLRIATKALKDGDMVEVDANKGVVRKI